MKYISTPLRLPQSNKQAKCNIITVTSLSTNLTLFKKEKKIYSNTSLLNPLPPPPLFFLGGG